LEYWVVIPEPPTEPQDYLVEVAVLDWEGEKIKHLMSRICGPGPGTLVWDCTDDGGNLVLDGAYNFLMTGRDPETEEVVYQGQVPAVIYYSIDRAQAMIGKTDENGIYETESLDYFPSLQDLGRFTCYNENREEIGTCAFIDNVKFIIDRSETITDEHGNPIGVEHTYMECDTVLKQGANRIDLIWKPDGAKTIVSY
jgi:hypothetical protein